MTSMARKKANIRTYDQDGYRRRAACVCVKDHSEREVLLVSTSRNPELWIIPGGGIEPTEEVQMAALREVLEEAGVKGQLDRCLGVFESPASKTRTIVFVMVVAELLDEWDEARSMGRRRKWFSMDDARIHLKLHRPAHLLYLDNLCNRSSDTSDNNDSSSNGGSNGRDPKSDNDNPS